MSYHTIKFPQFPEYVVFLAYYTGATTESLTTVKSELINRNPDYDYCFLSTGLIISLEQLRSSIYKSVLNFEHENMKAKSLNTEILFNLSPVNNINYALKRFGINENRSDVLVIKVYKKEDAADFEEVNRKISVLLGANAVELSDKVLEDQLDLNDFKKLYKLSEKGTSIPQESYTSVAVASNLLRGL